MQTKHSNFVLAKLRKIALIQTGIFRRTFKSKRLRRGAPGAFGKCHNRPKLFQDHPLSEITGNTGPT